MNGRQFSQKIVIGFQLVDLALDNAIILLFKPSEDGGVHRPSFGYVMHLDNRRPSAVRRCSRGRGFPGTGIETELGPCLFEHVPVGIMRLQPRHDFRFDSGTGGYPSQIVIRGLAFSRASHITSSS